MSERSFFLIGKIKAIPLWIYPLLISTLLFVPVKWLVPGGDGLWYMDIALNIYRGHGLVDTDLTPVITRPLYPLLLASSFWLFGVSIEAAFIITRVFYVLNTLLVYFTGQELYGKEVGLIASLLVLSSFSISEWSAMIYLDPVLPSFMLLSVLLIFVAFERKEYSWFALAGISLGAGYLLKETAGLLFPLAPLMLAWIKDYHKKKCLRGTILLIAVATLVVLPWVVYVYNITGQSKLMLGPSAHVVSTFSINAFKEIDLRSLLLALANYYKFQLSENFFFAPLFVVAWIFTLISAFREKKPSQVMLIALLLYCPMIVFQGLAGYRASQGIALFLLSYVALANFLSVLGRCVGSRLTILSSKKALTGLSHWTSVILACVVILVQAGEREVEFYGQPRILISNFGRGNMLDHVKRFNTIGYILQMDKEWDSGTKSDDTLAQAMLTHIPPGSRVMSTWARGPYWSAKGNYPIYSTPWTYLSPGYSLRVVPGQTQHALFFREYPPLAESSTEVGQYYLGVLTEEDLLDNVEENSIDYVIVTSLTSYENLYFMNQPDFVQVASVEDGVASIYKVVATKPHEFGTYFVNGTQTFLQSLRQEHPERYREIESNLLEGKLGWGQSEIQKLLNRQYPTVKQVVTMNDYVRSIRARGPQAIEEATIMYQQKATLIPGNPWPYVTLGALYLAQDNIEEALAAYEQAVASSPDEPQIRLYLAEAYMTKAQMTGERKDYDNALESYRQAFSLTPDNPQIHDALLQAYLALGDQYFDQDLLPQVITAYEKGIDLDPDNIQVYWKLAQVYESLGRTDDAVSVYARAAGRWPARADAHLRLGQAYEAQGNTQGALAEYQRVVKLEPTLASAYTQLGNLYRNQDRTEDIIALYQTAARKNPAAAWPHLELGKIYLQQVDAP